MFDTRVGAQVIQVGQVPVPELIKLYTGANGQPEGVHPNVGVVSVEVTKEFGFKV
jgi:hypothetical protein